jgi:hypothetical protein
MYQNRLFLLTMTCLFQVGYAFTLYSSTQHLARTFSVYASGMSPVASVGVAAAIEVNACLFSILSAALGPHAGPWIPRASICAMILVFGGNLYSMWLSAPQQPLWATIFFASSVLVGTFFSPKATGQLLALLGEIPPKSGGPSVESRTLAVPVAPERALVQGGYGEAYGPRVDRTPTGAGAPRPAGPPAPQSPIVKREGPSSSPAPSANKGPVVTPAASPRNVQGHAGPDPKGPVLPVTGVKDLTDAALDRVGLTRSALEELAGIVKAAQRGTPPALTAEQRVLAAYHWPRCHRLALVKELGKDRTTVINAVTRVEAALKAAGITIPTGANQVVP